MKLHLVSIVGLAIGFAAPAVAQERFGTCAGPEDACKQIANLIKAYDEAFNKRDAAAIGAIAAPDVVEMYEGPMLSGREAYEKFHDDLFKSGSSNVVVNTDQLHVAGDTAWGVGDWNDTGPGPNNTTQPYHGNWGAVWVRNAGTWKLRMLTNNVIKAPPR